jgi:septal ring factor EnvC (AmiA/AmiB activator)
MDKVARRILFIPVWSLVAVGLALPFAVSGTRAEGGAAQPAASASDLEVRRAQNTAEHERILKALTVSEARATEIEAEIAAIRKDNASLSAALVQAAKTERKLGDEIAVIAGRLGELDVQQEGLRASLAERRDVLAEVLGALQRMGLNPPPAILVRPEDALSSVRSSILLAAVVPELRGETEVLIADLRELQRLAAEIGAEQERLATTVAHQAEEQKRLSLLLDEKRRLQAESEEMLAAEQARAAEAGSLAELIEALEGEIEIAALQEERRARARDEAIAGARTPLSLGSLAFSAMKGRIGLPAAGRLDRRFGEADGSGGTLQGDMLATHSAAIVTAPVDGSVLYAGPFRSYGQLLILNAGEGYHVVLAGMGRISVSPGQAVLAGEPIGLMGDTRIASAVALSGPLAGADAGPELYVEFRKDGKPVDPAPWWAERTTGRTRNDS